MLCTEIDRHSIQKEEETKTNMKEKYYESVSFKFRYPIINFVSSKGIFCLHASLGLRSPLFLMYQCGIWNVIFEEKIEFGSAVQIVERASLISWEPGMDDSGSLNFQLPGRVKLQSRG